jgi:hypothetical protein
MIQREEEVVTVTYESLLHVSCRHSGASPGFHDIAAHRCRPFDDFT